MNILMLNPACRLPLGGKYERYFTGAGCRFPFSVAKKCSEPPRYAPFPFFMAYAAALLEKERFVVKVIDAVPLNLSGHEFLVRALDAMPQVVFMEPATVSFSNALEICRRIKARAKAVVILGGPHVTAVPGQTLRENLQVDFVIAGEYEVALLNLMTSLRDGIDYLSLPGIGYRTNGGEIHVNGRTRLIDPVDQLPFPARHLFPSYFNNDIALYHDGFCQGRPAVQMHSSRGCPFECNFCLWVTVLYNGRKHRVFSPKRVVDEMVHVAERYKAREIYFDDDNFTADKEHVLNLCDEILGRGIVVKWSVMGDMMVTDSAMLARMASAGCIGMKFGLESADRGVLKLSGKPLDPERIPLLVEQAASLGIKTHMTVTLGLIGETQETIRQTFKYACSTDVDSVQFSIATPYPGTPFHQTLEREGRLKNDSWTRFDGYNSSAIQYDELSANYLEAFARSSNMLWIRNKMLRPLWVFRQIRYLVRLYRLQGLRGVRRRCERLWGIVLEGLSSTFPLRT